MIQRGQAFRLAKADGVQRIVRVVSRRRSMVSLAGLAAYNCDVLVLRKDGSEEGVQRTRTTVGAEALTERVPQYDINW